MVKKNPRGLQRERKRKKRNEREREDANKREKEPRGLCVSSAMFSLRRITTSRSDGERRIPREKGGREKDRVRRQQRATRGGGRGRKGERGKRETSRRQSWSSCSYVLHTLAEHGERALYMLLHCDTQCSIISPSIPSALIEERIRRASAREGSRGRNGQGSRAGGEGYRGGWKKEGRKHSGGVVDPMATILCTTSVFKSGPRRTSARNKDLLSHTQPRSSAAWIIRPGRTAKYEIAPKITIF